MSPPSVKWGQGSLFPDENRPGTEGNPYAVKAAQRLAMARANIERLWQIDRAAAVRLAQAAHVPLWGRCPLEDARWNLLALFEPARFLNTLAQVAQRRWKAFGLLVTPLRGSPVLDLITDADWRTIPLAPELAALVAQPRPSHGQA